MEGNNLHFSATSPDANTDHSFRYRSTATLISLVLEAGHLCPHRTIDKYVEAFTNFRPTDGKSWTDLEPEFPLGFDLKSKVIKLDSEHMSGSAFLHSAISN